MSKTEELNNLFAVWKEARCKDDRFVRDGIINEKLWNENQLKILFIFKDTNDKVYEKLPENKKAEYKDDLRNMLNQDDKPWPRIGYLSYGLQYTTESLILDFQIAKENFVKACKQSAVMNLKKLPGRDKADDDEITQFIEQNQNFIEKEIRIIEPEIIILGGTLKFCKKAWGEPEYADERICKFKSFGDCFCVDYIHPSQRNIRDDMLYYTLVVYYQKHLQRQIPSH